MHLPPLCLSESRNNARRNLLSGVYLWVRKSVKSCAFLLRHRREFAPAPALRAYFTHKFTPLSTQFSRILYMEWINLLSQVFQLQTILQTIRSLKKCHLWKTQTKRSMKRSFERSFFKGKDRLKWPGNDLIVARSFLSRLKDHLGLKNPAQASWYLWE